MALISIFYSTYLLQLLIFVCIEISFLCCGVTLKEFVSVCLSGSNAWVVIFSSLNLINTDTCDKTEKIHGLSLRGRLYRRGKSIFCPGVASYRSCGSLNHIDATNTAETASNQSVQKNLAEVCLR